MKKQTFIVIVAVLVAWACTSNDVPEVNCSSMTLSYATQVAPIITSSCATNSSCHGANSSNGPGPLTSYTAVFTHREDIKAAVSSGIMPKNSTLTSDQKNSIICWIENGAQNN